MEENQTQHGLRIPLVRFQNAGRESTGCLCRITSALFYLPNIETCLKKKNRTHIIKNLRAKGSGMSTADPLISCAIQTTLGTPMRDFADCMNKLIRSN